MGTQQILLIVLSVIIVGIAVAVGITMFNTQAINSNRDACIADMNNFAAQASAYYKTPASHGGCGSTASNMAVLTLINWIGMRSDDTHLVTGNGTFLVAIAGNVVTFTAAGNESGVAPVTTVDVTTGVITTVANPVAA